jgi:hypothetical protein
MYGNVYNAVIATGFLIPLMKNIRRTHRRYLLLFLVAAGTFGMLLQVSAIFVVLFVATGVTLGIYAMTLRCPNCNKAVLRYPQLFIYSLLVPRRCRHCDYDLTGGQDPYTPQPRGHDSS